MVYGERVSDRQPGSRQEAAAAEGRAAMVVSILFRHGRGRAGYEATGTISPKLIWQLASPQWQFDDATFDRSAAAFDNPDHVAIVIHNYRWRLGLAEASRNTTSWKSGLPKGRSSPCRRLPWRATPMAHRTPTRARMPKNSRANMRTGSSQAASGIICPRKPRRLLPRPCSKSTATERRAGRRSIRRRRAPIPKPPRFLQSIAAAEPRPSAPVDSSIVMVEARKPVPEPVPNR